MPDYSSYIRTIYSLHDQFKESFIGAFSEEYGDEYKNCNEIIISGLGGSSFGGRILQSVFTQKDLLIPVSLLFDYSLPAYADEKTLVIATSFSGNSEETLSVLEDSVSRGCKTLIITQGGKLKNIVEKKILPGYIFGDELCYAKAPRLGIGYMVGSTFGMLSKLGYIKFTQKDAENMYKYLSEFYKLLLSNDAVIKHLTEKMQDKIPVFITSEHLSEAAHIWRNFYNETAKSMGFVESIPYMNHHFLESLKYPEERVRGMLFVIIKSKLFNPRNMKRLEITADIIKDKNFSDVTLNLSGNSRLHEIFELIIIGCIVSYNIAQKHNEDPVANEMVDRLKSELAK